jgi:UTP--glucose-1-phosphate uridylyltransferase
MAQKIRKIVIPVAGYGTRFLPFTKSIPKEMLPLVDRPIIQYIVEQAVDAGIEQVILITGYSKRAIEDYFDYNVELEYLLDKKGKTAQKQLIRDVSDIAKFVYIRQKEMRGHGHAVLQAKDVVGDEPFVVMWGDELYQGPRSVLKQMIDAYERLDAPVLFSLRREGEGDGDKYGYVKTGEDLGNGTFRVDTLVEKPGDANRPSSLAALGCYILTPEIFPYLERQAPGVGGEIITIDAVNAMAKDRPVYTQECFGLTYHDCGDKLGYMKATVDFALQRDDIGPAFREHLKNLGL